jgi:hypothetical protein
VNGSEPGRTVLIRSTEDDTHQALGVNICSGFEEHIDGWSREVNELVNRKCVPRALVDQQVKIGRSELYSARLHSHLIFRLINLQRALGRRNVRQQARPFARQVQHNDEGHL